jgi:hypothetical protein
MLVFIVVVMIDECSGMWAVLSHRLLYVLAGYSESITTNLIIRLHLGRMVVCMEAAKHVKHYR